MPVSMDFMSVSSYGSGTVSSGVVRIIKDLDEPLEGKDVLIVEDIIDSGRTLAYLIEVLKQMCIRDRSKAIRRMGGCKDEHLINRIGAWREDWIGKGTKSGKAQSILELLEESGPVTMKTRKMILDETDAERLSVWLKAAARAGSEACLLYTSRCV